MARKSLKLKSYLYKVNLIIFKYTLFKFHYKKIKISI